MLLLTNVDKKDLCTSEFQKHIKIQMYTSNEDATKELLLTGRFVLRVSVRAQAREKQTNL